MAYDRKPAALLAQELADKIACWERPTTVEHSFGNKQNRQVQGSIQYIAFPPPPATEGSMATINVKCLRHPEGWNGTAIDENHVKCTCGETHPTPQPSQVFAERELAIRESEAERKLRQVELYESMFNLVKAGIYKKLGF